MYVDVLAVKATLIRTSCRSCYMYMCEHLIAQCQYPFYGDSSPSWVGIASLSTQPANLPSTTVKSRYVSIFLHVPSLAT